MSSVVVDVVRDVGDGYAVRGRLDASQRFGEQIPFCEPYWYQGYRSRHYSASHRQFRDKLRAFVEKEIKPNVDEWVESEQGYPKDLHLKFYDAGLGGAIFPKEHGGTPPPNFDAFHELILWYELGRVGGGGVLGQLSINSMALPPVLQFGSQALKDKVCRDVITGRKHLSLAISEPGAGSDVANIQTLAEKKVDRVTGEEYYLINGSKKWITGGAMADFFTMAVRMDPGKKGLSLLLVDRDTPGISVRKMRTQFDNSHNTTYIVLEDVRVPVTALIGKEGDGFKYILHNFNHERFVIAASCTAMCRLCYEESIKEALTRRTFGSRLIQHQVIRAKLAEMVRLIEALQDNLERVALQFAEGVPDHELGGQCALLKVNASKTFEHCAREAAQIFGGSSVVREGRGARVERLYREVRAQAIPGGSEEILLDLAIRQAAAHVPSKI